MSSQLPSVLVTGGTRGIGRAVCDILAPDHHLIVGGRDADTVAAVVAGYPSAEGFVAELTDPAATARAVERLGEVDAVVHSAGIWSQGTVADVSRDQWREVLEINVVAVADLTRMLLPRLRAARGHVVLINSGAGLVARANIGPYSASKFALVALADSLREEERGVVRVTSVHPGRVGTDMQEEIFALAGKPYEAGEHIRPESIAASVRLALALGRDANVDSISVRSGS